MAGIRRETRIILQERDQRLLSSLATLRIVDREQARIIMGIRSVSRANARLLALVRSGYLRRSFVGAIGASRRAIYRRPSDRSRWREAYTYHQLAINSVFLRLFYLQLPAGVSPRHFLRFTTPPIPTLPLIPDGLIELERGSKVDALFLEVDLGSEKGSIWQRKAELYLRLALSGEFVSHFGVKRFRVLVIASSDRRALGIQKVVRSVTPKLFYISDFETIKREGFFSPVWLRPEAEGRHSLI